jgi:hypothetical protein
MQLTQFVTVAWLFKEPLPESGGGCGCGGDGDGETYVMYNI